MIDKSSADLSASVLEFNADGTYMLWEQDGYFWKELYNDTYYVEDDMLVLTDSEGGKDYEITSMTSSKVTMRYCEEYYDANLGKQCVKTIVRTYKKDEAWVTPALFQLKDYHVSLNVQGQYQIISNGTDVTYRSLTPYVADVDGSGLITANFVGTAIVEVMANEGSHTFEVNVKSKYPKYEEPCLDFTKTEAQIHKLYGDNYMGKDKNGGQYFRFANYYHVYYFKGTMYHAVLLLPSVDADTAIDFLLERYHYALYDEELNSLVFTNKTDLWAVLGTYSSTSFGTGFSIEYIPRDNGGEANDGNANNHRRFLSPEKRFMEQMEDFLDLHKWTE